MADIVIKNGTIVGPEGRVRGGIAVSDGIIVAIGTDAHLPQARRTINAEGKYILPGIIDVHTHFGVFAPLERDLKGTEAAVCGGVTTVNDTIGLASESTARGSFFDKLPGWIETWNKNSLVDGVFSSIIVTDLHIKEIPAMAKDYGITSFKFPMFYKGEEAEQLDSTPIDDGILYEGFKSVAAIGRHAKAMIHAENYEVFRRFKKELVAQGRNDLAAWTESRPGFVEALDLEKAIAFARLTGCSLYQVHCSAHESVDIVDRVKREGVDITCETCTPYLTMTKNAPIGMCGKVNPPWKDQKDIERLWKGIQEGTVTCIGTDAVPNEYMTMKQGTVWDAFPGYSCIESFLPIMLSEGVNKGRITLEKLVEIACVNNAKAFGLYPRKGTIRIGSDADIVLVDLDKEVTLSAQTHHECQDFSIYEGWKVKGYPVMTMVRGNVVMENGEVMGKPGSGMYLPRGHL